MHLGTLACIFTQFSTFLPYILAQEAWYSRFPPCALQCADTLVPQSQCNLQDTSCLCRDTNFTMEMRHCLMTSCTVKEVLTTTNITTVACGAPIRNRSPLMYSTLIGFIVPTALAVFARYAARIAYGKMTWLEDGCMMIIVMLDIGFYTAGLMSVRHGLGKDIWKVPFNDITKTILFDWIAEILYLPMLAFVRIYFLLFFLSIFTCKRFRLIAWGVIIFQVLLTVIVVPQVIFACRPIRYTWVRWDGEHRVKCINTVPIAFVHSSLSVVSDIVTLCLPISQVLKLQLGWKKKVGVLVMLCIGVFVTIVTIIRMKTIPDLQRPTNITWELLDPSLWSMVEVQVAIICACMPAIRLAVTRLFPSTADTVFSESRPSFVKSSNTKTPPFERQTRLQSHESFVQLVEMKPKDEPHERRVSVV